MPGRVDVYGRHQGRSAPFGGFVVHGDDEDLRFTARDVVSTALSAPAGQERAVAVLLAVRDRVAPARMDDFWVALIEHSVDILRPFLAVYGDELTNGPSLPGPSQAGHQAEPVTDVVLGLVNDALAHASAGDRLAVAEVVRLIFALDEQQRAQALGSIINMALVVGELVRTRGVSDGPSAN